LENSGFPGRLVDKASAVLEHGDTGYKTVVAIPATNAA
jgi:hypothetical protein